MSKNNDCTTNRSPCDRRRASSDNVCQHYPEDQSHEDHCYHNDPDMIAAGAPCNCDEPQHTEQCGEYWDRGLDCQCIPAGVKQAIRDGADPSEVM